MSKSKPSLVRLAEMTPGQSGDFFVLLCERTRSARRDGKLYYTCRFRDTLRTATLMVWSDGPWYEVCDTTWQQGRFYKIRGTYDEHKVYGPQIDAQNIREVIDADRDGDFDPLEYVEHSRYNSDEMYQDLWNFAESQIENVPLRRLVLTILERKKQAIKRLPATQKHFYPFAGGLLEHMLSVAHSCLHLVDKYVANYPELNPPINRDLVLAGAILHDIGRTVEFNDDPMNVQPTTDGHFVGHLILGRDLVRDTSRELGDVDADLARMLEHIVLTHLTLPEWGSPRLPLIPEVLIIHHADDLDAKLEMYVRCLTHDKEPGDFTARDPVLGRQLFKGRTV